MLILRMDVSGILEGGAGDVGKGSQVTKAKVRRASKLRELLKSSDGLHNISKLNLHAGFVTFSCAIPLL